MRKYFITFLALLTVLAISCNNRPTQASNFVETDNTPSTVDETTGVSSLKIANSTSASSPVIAVNGDKIILAWGVNDTLKYMSSSDGGKDGTRSAVLNLNPPNSSTKVKSPHIFFKSDDTIVVVATVNSGTISTSGTEQPIVDAVAKFQTSDNGIGYISFNANLWNAAGLTANASTPASPNGWQKILLGNSDYNNLPAGTIRTVAGAGRISGSQLVLPLKLADSSGNNDSAIKVTSTAGNKWVLANGTISGAESGKDTKFKTDGSTALNGTANKSFEATSKYTIDANGTVSEGATATIGDGTEEASIAELSDGTVVTFTKEAGGLVFRRIPADKLTGTIK